MDLFEETLGKFTKQMQVTEHTTVVDRYCYQGTERINEAVCKKLSSKGIIPPESTLYRSDENEKK